MLDFKENNPMPLSENDALAEKIREAIALSKMGKKEIADAMGVSKQSVTGWEKTGRITKRNLGKLAELLFLKINWFLLPNDVLPKSHGGVILEEVPSKKLKFDQNVSPASIGKRAIPVISAIQAGALKEINDPYAIGDGFAVEYTDDNMSRWAFGLEIEGDSMLPEFRPGDRVLIDPELSPNPGDFVVAKNGKQEATFKKYRPRGIDARGNTIFELVPLNDDYAIMRSDTENLQIIGVMLEHRKKYRRSR